MQPWNIWIFWIFLALYFIQLTVEVYLDLRNLRNMNRHQQAIPPLFKDLFTIEEYQKTIAYNRAQTHFSWSKKSFDTLLLFAFILSGSFHWVERGVQYFIPNGLWEQVAYPFALFGIFYLLGLPFTIYHQFVLEEKFGFNRTKPSTFIVDQVKTLFISLVLGVPLLAGLFYLVGRFQNGWWIAGWILVLLFQFLITALFPVVLAPLFYKFTPLPDGNLKERLLELAKKIQFKMSGIFTIDGSRRSTHSNAFFAGMGRARRIVLFDTLVKNLSEPEIASVIGHEMGHNKLKHVQKGLILSTLASLLGFFILSRLLYWKEFYQAFGVPAPSIAVGFVLFGLLSGVFTFPLNPLFKWLSRKHEYEADQFSIAVTADPKHMASSLLKLTKDNLSNLTPDPWYSFYHYSHPTTAERTAAIEKSAQ